MDDLENEQRSEHRLFRALVLMGGTLALSCGGMSKTDGDGSGGASNGGASNGGASNGGATSGGTGPLIGTGGSIGIGGKPIMPDPAGSAGQLATGGMPGVNPPPLPCPAAQLDCGAMLPSCTGEGYTLPDYCACNAALPASPDDCDAGEEFVCLRGTYAPSGQLLSEIVPFQCSCVPAVDNCGEACDAAFIFSGDGLSCEDPTPDTVICGCAWVYLR